MAHAAELRHHPLAAKSARIVPVVPPVALLRLAPCGQAEDRDGDGEDRERRGRIQDDRYDAHGQRGDQRLHRLND